MPENPRRDFFTRHRTGLLASATVLLALGGAYVWGMGEVERGVKQYLDTVVIPGAARAGFVFTYDGVAREGFGTVVVRAPRFLARQGEDVARLETTSIGVMPTGWRRVRLSLPEGLRLSGAHGAVAIYGDGPIRVRLGWDQLNQPPHEGGLSLPRSFVTKLTDENGKTLGEFQLTQSARAEFAVRHRGPRVEGQLELGRSRLQEMVSGMSILRLSDLQANYTLEPDAKGRIAMTQQVKVQGMRFEGTRTTKAPDAYLPLDIAWDISGRLVPLPPEVKPQTGELPMTAKEPDADFGPSYLLEELNVKQASLGISGTVLAKAEGTLHATPEDQTPAGTLRVTLVGLAKLRKSLAALGNDGNGYLTMFDSAVTTVAGWGTRLPNHDIEVLVTRKPQEGLRFGPMMADAAIGQLMRGVMTSMGAKLAPETRDSQPSRASQEGMTPQGKPIPDNYVPPMETGDELPMSPMMRPDKPLSHQ